ncbi:MAG: hypothetical protein P4L99_09660 [Chthoniobacter sp.]|nr:hypothetical protein [Chthoniobacter sp.]
MKILFLSFLAVGALASEGLAQAPVAIGPGSVKITKVDISGVKSPEYQIVGGPQKRSKTGTWLEIEVAFETKVDDIDELTFNYNVLIEKSLLDGSVTHVNIPKGPEHYSVMYISPRALEKLVNGKTFTAASIGNAWITVSRQGQVLDAPVANPKAAYKPTAMPNLPHLAGLLLNKNETPFAPLFYDRYEAIRAAR